MYLVSRNLSRSGDVFQLYLSDWHACLCCPYCPATDKYYIISGQHRFKAAKQWRDARQLKRLPLPDWCQYFHCEILKQGLTRKVIEETAGRLQAQSSVVRSMSIADTMRHFFELQQRDPDESVQSLLGTTYVNTGKSARDATQVFPRSHVVYCGTDLFKSSY